MTDVTVLRETRVEQRAWDPRGLSGARLGDDHRVPMRPQRVEDRRQVRVDREHVHRAAL